MVLTSDVISTTASEKSSFDVVSLTSKVLKEPSTSEIIKCVIENPSFECALSIVQVASASLKATAPRAIAQIIIVFLLTPLLKRFLSS